MTRVYNDLLLADDEGDVSALCLLDLTAAFDTVDHDLSICRLERQFGLRGVVLYWFSTYTCQANRFMSYMETPRRPSSAIGAPRFCTGSAAVQYTANLSDVVAAHHNNLHSYADDSQLYLQCHRQDMKTAVGRLEECIMDVSHWMAANRVEVNADKTELLCAWAGSNYTVLLQCLNVYGYQKK